MIEDELSTCNLEEINDYLEEENVSKFREFLYSLKPNVKNNPVFTQKIDDFDKEKRTKFHLAIKKNFTFLNSETKDVDDSKIIKISYTKKPQQSSLSFHLYKRNWDTMQALNKLARAMHKRPGDFFFAGTKDKRAVTIQQITAKSVTKNELAGLTKNPSWNFEEITFSNLTYTSSLLKIGDLYGNRFTLALRFLEHIDPSKIDKNIENLKKSGFVNYFGLQRFGSKLEVKTHETGKLLLKKRYQEAFESILLADDKTSDLHKTMQEFLTDFDFDKTLSKLTYRNNIEKTLIMGLRQCKTDYLRAFMTLNRTMRNLYLHAYQSFLWNKLVSKRLQEFGIKVG